ncbi:MAG: 50S ribosomal protein L13 [Chlamydiales bacterium 38-26]|nr:50S ribosomal protein L13 [Chlamydiales bacterium]OJV08447.1 MAG: 50S ribosomal protein L13 [Chlamydiales bacterium 38-26]
MAQQKNKTIMHRKEDSKPQWFILDATGKTLGRFAAEIAKILRGKHKPTFTTYSDAGDGVIVLNADKIRVTGNKEAQKEYISYTGYMGGLRRTPYYVMKSRKPEFIIEHAVKGMMPHSRLARAQIKRLRVFKGAEHNLDAQKPIKANI